MEIVVTYSHSVKDASGNLHHYRSEVRDEIDVEGLTGEQKITKFRQIHYFYHNELHKAIAAFEESDGVPESLRANHKDAAAPAVKAKRNS